MGSVLSGLLTAGGASIVAVDDLSSGRWENLAPATGDRLECIQASVTDRVAMESLVRWDTLDLVVHLAAISSLPECEADPAKAIEVNVAGTAAVIEMARRGGVSFLVNASTSAIYERTSTLPFAETDPVAPSLIYPQSKLFAERLLSSTAEKFGMSGANLRFFNLFGPYQDFRRTSPPLLNYLVRQATRGEPAVLHSDGSQRRDYVSTYDACDAIGLLMAERPSGVTCWNVCSGVDFSVREIAGIVSSALEIALDVQYREAELLWDAYPTLSMPPRPLNFKIVEHETNKRSLGDPTRLRDDLGWMVEPDVALAIATVAREIAQHIRDS